METFKSNPFDSEKKIMAVLETLKLTVFMSITCYENTVTHASEIECRFPDDPPIDHVHTNLSEGEFDLLQIEGRCFLFCTTERYSSEVNNNIV